MGHTYALLVLEKKLTDVLVMQWWPETFEKIKQVCIAERPDFLLSDLLADASVDVARELDIPLAMHYPQMPIRMFISPSYLSSPSTSPEIGLVLLTNPYTQRCYHRHTFPVSQGCS